MLSRGGVVSDESVNRSGLDCLSESASKRSDLRAAAAWCKSLRSWSAERLNARGDTTLWSLTRNICATCRLPTMAACQGSNRPTGQQLSRGSSLPVGVLGPRAVARGQEIPHVLTRSGLDDCGVSNVAEGRAVSPATEILSGIM